MLARLITTLRALAAPAQPGRSAVMDPPSEDLAADFVDAHMIVSDCPQLLLTETQRHLLASLDDLLARGSPSSLDDDEPSGESGRDAVRRLAAQILRSLDEPA